MTPPPHYRDEARGRRRSSTSQLPALEPLLSLKQVAAWLGCSDRHIAKVAKSGELPFVELALSGSRWQMRFEQTSVRDFIASRQSGVER